ncbi:MAG TPA: nuclear transport factor 2 family protein [Mycobacteriales bacterium]|jgi:predicted ester cyclase
MLDTRRVIDAIFADAATGDVEKVMRWWAPDGILEDVTIAKAYHGHREISDYLEMYFRALPDLTFEPMRLVVSGPTAVVEWAKTTTVASTFDGVEPAGQELYLHAIDIFHVTGGLIRHESSWYGDAWLRRRLEDTGATGVPPALPVTRHPSMNERTA